MSESNGRKKISVFLSVSLLALSFLAWGIPNAQSTEAIGKFTHVEGRVDALRGGSLPAAPVKVEDPVFLKDIIRTKSDSKAEITFTDNSLLRIAQRSRIDVSEYIVEEGRRSAVIKLPRGKVEAIVPEERVKRISISPEANRFEIHTPNAVAGVRGTDFFVFQERDTTGVFVVYGTVCVYNHRFAKDVVCVPAGHLTFIDALQRPISPRRATDGETKRLEKETALLDTMTVTQKEPTRTFTDIVLTPLLTTWVTTTPPVSETSQDVMRLITVPSVEVGRTSLSGSLIAGPAGSFDHISVFLNNVIFLASSTGQKPSLWQTNSVNGQYSFSKGYLTPGNIANTNSSILVSNGNGLSADFHFTLWDTASNMWNAGINNGKGILKGGSYTGQIDFSGDATGIIRTGAFSGTGKGTAR